MTYYRMTRIMGSDIPKICVCCDRGIKGQPRTTHANGKWRLYCGRCYRECRPHPDKTRCFSRGGQNLLADAMEKVIKEQRETYKKRIEENVG